MTQSNGVNHHNVEQLLASIRTRMAEGTDNSLEPGGMYRGTPTGFRRDNALAEDTSDFELPSIFKTTAEPEPTRPNVLGRLSDALRSSPIVGEATPQAQTYEARSPRTVIRFEPQRGRMIEPPMPEATPPGAVGSPLKPTTAAPVQAASSAQPEPVEQQVRREMPSFFDTRMKRLGEPPKPRAPDAVPAAENLTAASNSHPVIEAQGTPRLHEPELVIPQPPALPVLPPDPDMSARPDADMDDIAAQMMRPILRQWLSDNMPKIVEKALRSEAGAGLPPSSGDDPDVSGR